MMSNDLNGFVDEAILKRIATLRTRPVFDTSRPGHGKHLVHIVGARPNFVKLAPLHHALQGMAQQIVHTGQHYDHRMSESFFQALDIPEPDINLSIGSGSHSVQTARTMIALQEHFEAAPPAAVIVYGDVNSTLAASLVAAKMHIPCIHVEAGLRSGDRAMPEEVNRLVTDRLCDVLLTPSDDASATLISEAAAPETVFCVGNIMIDTLARLLPRIAALPPVLPDLPDRFVLATLHRPSNVDRSDQLKRILDVLEDLSRDVPIVFPVHPRTRMRIADLGWSIPADRIHMIEPQDYLSFVALQRGALAVITDSGGIQEETTWLSKPCLTLRDTTERPVTVDVGTNLLLGDDPAALRPALDEILAGRAKTGAIPEYWDGQTALRIRAILDALGLCVPA